MMLSDVCLTSVAYIEPKSRTERPRKTKIGTEVAHVTRDSDPLSRSKGQTSRSPGRFTHRRVGASGSCSGGRGNVLAVENCCYVAVFLAARCASAPTEEERGGGISWRPPAYSLFLLGRTFGNSKRIFSAYKAAWCGIISKNLVHRHSRTTEKLRKRKHD